ncbi:hypothetical protein [Vibrio owensii]|uniref:hypothetical protein n=1 Tax=Vibrio owensii TaxID=696485 RepID=UPI0018F13A8A|nr:hypothetical protein [Vibrio owensii]
MKKFNQLALILALGAAPISANAVVNLNVGERDLLEHTFVGAAPEWIDQMVPARQTALRARFRGASSCSGNVGLTISNAFTDGRLKEMYEAAPDVLRGLVSSQGAIYLTTLFVQKSNPNLYEFLTEGFNLGFADFLDGVRSCEALGDTLMSTAFMSDISSAAQMSSVERMASGEYDWGEDITKYREKLEDATAEGVKWFFGDGDSGDAMAGGETSPPIAVVADSVVIGSCLNRGVESSACNEDVAANLPEPDDKRESPYNRMLKVTFGDEVGDIRSVAQEILGEKSIRICSGCDTSTQEGRGAQSFLDSHKKDVYEKLGDIYYRDPDAITSDEYESVSAPGAVNVTYTHLRGLQLLQNDSHVQRIYSTGLAFDVAYLRTMFALDELERAFAATMLDGKTKASGMVEEIGVYRDLVRAERERLERHYRERGYEPQLYAKKLLSVTIASADR